MAPASGLLDEPPQLARPVNTSTVRTTAPTANAADLRAKRASRPAQEVEEPKRRPSVATRFILIVRLRSLQIGMTESRNVSRILQLYLGRRFATAAVAARDIWASVGLSDAEFLEIGPQVPRTQALASSRCAHCVRIFATFHCCRCRTTMLNFGFT